MQTERPLFAAAIICPVADMYWGEHLPSHPHPLVQPAVPQRLLKLPQSHTGKAGTGLLPVVRLLAYTMVPQQLLLWQSWTWCICMHRFMGRGCTIHDGVCNATKVFV
jgi:hypothetical protein